MDAPRVNLAASSSAVVNAACQHRTRSPYDYLYPNERTRYLYGACHARHPRGSVCASWSPHKRAILSDCRAHAIARVLRVARQSCLARAIPGARLSLIASPRFPCPSHSTSYGDCYLPRKGSSHCASSTPSTIARMSHERPKEIDPRVTRPIPTEEAITTVVGILPIVGIGAPCLHVRAVYVTIEPSSQRGKLAFLEDVPTGGTPQCP